MNRPSSSDDGPTVIRTGPTGGPVSDFAPSSTFRSDSLPEGLRLGEYEIRSVIGEGGFGIVYLAYDHFLQRQVALKEYMPSTLAGRARTGLDVVVKAERHRDTFLAGLRSFVNEARLLAQFDHPALVKVYRFWEAHGTAYMVMPYCVGPTLKEALASHDGPPDEDWLRHHLLGPLLEALALLHKAQCLHRDIAPDNILLTDTGPLLLDFGAARQIIGDMSQTLTVVLKPGYAPIEQYGEVAGMGQGAWTDLYALAGVVRYALTGKVPMAATSRIVQDTLVPLAVSAAGQYSEMFLQAVDAALAVKPADRPQSIAAFQALLDGLAPADQSQPDAAAPSLPVSPTPGGRGGLPVATASLPRTTASPELTTRTGPRSWSPTTRPGAPTRSSPLEDPVSATTPTTVAAGSRLGVPPLLVAGLVLMALGAGGWMFLSGQRDPTPMAVDPVPIAGPADPSTPQAAAASAAVLSSAKASAAAALPVVVEAAASVPPAVVTDPASAPSPAAPPLAAPIAKAVPPVPPRPLPPVGLPAPRVANTAPSEQITSADATPKRASLSPDRSARCSDILQKASLEPLSASDAAFLKSECR